jgi:hypothetical protein
MAKLYICISIDWEGEDLSGLRSINYLRKKFAWDVPFTHFICPAYFTSNIKNANNKINSFIRETDEIGLHVHMYKSLVKAAGVKFKTANNYYRNDLISKLFPYTISGRGVPLTSYSAEETWSLLNVSKDMLMHELNVDQLHGFRAGGWIINDRLVDQIQKLKFTYESSAIPPEILSNGYSESSNGNLRDDHGDKNGIFTQYILRLWGRNTEPSGFLQNNQLHQYMNTSYIKKTTLPFFMDKLLQMPNNGGMSDFTSAKATLIPLKELFLKEIEQNKKDRLIITGFHQEGDFQLKLPILEFINSISPEEKENIEFVTINEATQLFLKNIQ